MKDQMLISLSHAIGNILNVKKDINPLLILVRIKLI